MQMQSHLESKASPSRCRISAIAPAKINLSFDIVGLHADGYHEIVTLFQAVSLQDKLTFQICESKENTISLLVQDKSTADISLFPLDEHNLISKAIKLFLSTQKTSPAIKITVAIEKNIPIGAGLAGGSSNAAAALLALNQYFDSPFNKDELANLAAQLGADVAFCLQGGTAIGTGKGEKLEKIDLELDAHFLLVKPKNLSVSTEEAYKSFDKVCAGKYLSKQNAYDHIKMRKESLKLQIDEMPKTTQPKVFNCFEPVIFNKYPLLNQIKQSLLDFGCLEAHLTGSGPTIYARVKTAEHGQNILTDMTNLKLIDKKTNELIAIDVWLAKSTNHGAKISPDDQ